MILALLNSKVSSFIVQILNPTLSLQLGNVASIPLINVKNAIQEDISTLSKYNVENCKSDWDAFETSWDFKHHPLV